jgi:putative membrane protein
MNLFRHSRIPERKCTLRKPWYWVALLAALLIPSGVAWAHEGEPLSPHDLWSAWNWDASLLLGLGMAAWLYSRGAKGLWRSAGTGRGVSRWQVLSFASGLLILFVALVSPLDPLSGALFSAHMVQHLLLILVAAPLLVLGASPVVFAWGVPSSVRPGLGRWWHRQAGLRVSLSWAWRALSGPMFVWALHTIAVWAWHLPVAYQAALRNEWLHILEHLSFLGTALLFWWVVLRGDRLNRGLAALYVFTMALLSGVLGALITFSTSAWYPDYASTTLAWGLTPLEDQQLAGVIMWVPGNVVYLVALLWILWDWFQQMEKRDEGQKAGREPANSPKRKVFVGTDLQPPSRDDLTGVKG